MQVPARTYTHIQLVRNHYSRNHRERNMSLGSCSCCHHHISVTGLLTHKRAHTHTHTHTHMQLTRRPSPWLHQDWWKLVEFLILLMPDYLPHEWEHAQGLGF